MVILDCIGGAYCISSSHNYAGCGKRTVVRYVARRLGMHVVEYNCHDLMLSEMDTSVALAQAFKTAQRFRYFKQ